MKVDYYAIWCMEEEAGGTIIVREVFLVCGGVISRSLLQRDSRKTASVYLREKTHRFTC